LSVTQRAGATADNTTDRDTAVAEGENTMEIGAGAETARMTETKNMAVRMILVDATATTKVGMTVATSAGVTVATSAGVTVATSAGMTANADVTAIETQRSSSPRCGNPSRDGGADPCAMGANPNS